METVSEAEAAGNDMLRAGAVKFSFANLLSHHCPLMIVDEAHNAVSGLSREVHARTGFLGTQSTAEPSGCHQCENLVGSIVVDGDGSS